MAESNVPNDGLAIHETLDEVALGLLSGIDDHFRPPWLILGWNEDRHIWTVFAFRAAEWKEAGFSHARWAETDITGEMALLFAKDDKLYELGAMLGRSLGAQAPWGRIKEEESDADEKL